MANVLILGGGFGGVVAAETLATNLSHQHQVTLVSRDDRFLFYPALVRFAFGECDNGGLHLAAVTTRYWGQGLAMMSLRVPVEYILQLSGDPLMRYR